MSGRVKHRGHRAVTRPDDREKHVAPEPKFGLEAFDLAEVDALRNGDGTCHLPPTGACHDCGRPVAGERRFCGTVWSGTGTGYDVRSLG